MKKPLLRFAVASFSFAAAVTAAPKRAAAAPTPFTCPTETEYLVSNVWYDCVDGVGSECSTCSYYCPGLADDPNNGYETINMCQS